MFARRYGLVAVILLRHVVHLILHIGPHKTGSSYLQRRFYKDHDILMENGVLYPINDWIGGGHGHAYLVDKKQLSSIGDELNRIAKDKPSLKSVVISTENFDRLSRDDIKILRDKITIPTTVVYYLRRMDKTLFANWQEDVKFGSLETFSRFLLRHFAFPIESKIVNHSVVVDLWADVFGKSAISIVDYDDLVGTDTDIYCHFVETFCGINDVATPSNARENVSFSPVDSEILRIMHMFAKDKKQCGTNIVTKRFYELFNSKHALLDDARSVIAFGSKPFAVGESVVFRKMFTEFEENYKDRIVSRNLQFRSGSVEIIDDYWFQSDNLRGALERIYAELVNGVQ